MDPRYSAGGGSGAPPADSLLHRLWTGYFLPSLRARKPPEVRVVDLEVERLQAEPSVGRVRTQERTPAPGTQLVLAPGESKPLGVVLRSEIMEPSLVDQLVRLGLTSYEARAYVALTSRGRATAAEIARLAGLPRQRIYDVVETLIGRGFAIARPGRPLLYSAVTPSEAVTRLLDEHRSQLGQLEREAQDAVERLTPRFSAGRDETDPLDYIEVLREPGAISARFAELQTTVEHEILVFTKPPYAIPPAENIEGLRLLENKIARSVYERTIFDRPEHVEAVRRFIASGEQARVVDRLPIKLAILDERVAVFQMQDPIAGSEGLTIMIVEHPSLAELLKIAFEAVWASGTDFEKAAAA